MASYPQLERAATDFPFFARNLLTIRCKDGALATLELNAVQRLIHERAEAQREATGRVRLLVLKARQPGVSTYVEARFFWRTMHAKGLRAFILTHKDDATDNLFDMAKRFHTYLPRRLGPEMTVSNAKEMEFGVLESSYRVGTAKADGVGRSDTIQLFHGSEVAHWPNAERHAAGALQAVPSEPGTEVWLESTANGPAGLFYNMCMRAEAGIGEYELIFVPWFLHEPYTRTPPHDWAPGEEWQAYGERHVLSHAQLYWAWMKNAELAGSSGEGTERPCWLFRQEYPSSPQEAFQTSGTEAFILPELVEEAATRTVPEESWAPVILGVDVAHGGGDRTHVIDRQGHRLGYCVNESFDDRDEMTIAGRLARLIEDHAPQMVFVDVTGGYGNGVVGRLREQGFACVRGVNFGWKALEPKTYANKRAEMWGLMKQWLADGGTIVDDGILRRHLVAPGHRPDSSGKLLLEDKNSIRRRLGLSPDRADAAALTFAEPVVGNVNRFMPTQTESAYDPMEM